MRSKVFIAVTVKNIIYWDVMPCGSYNNQRFGVLLFTLMMGVIHSSKTSVLTRATHHHIPEDGILQETVLSGFKLLLYLLAGLVGGRREKWPMGEILTGFLLNPSQMRSPEFSSLIIGVYYGMFWKQGCHCSFICGKSHVHFLVFRLSV
jgi:hypothetical protein